jgi:prevent-host-death family protein
MEVIMEISAKELRGKPGQIIEQASRGTEVIVTIRGKRMARLIPYKDSPAKRDLEDEIFGIWENRDNSESVEEYVRSLRKGRTL